MYILDFGLDNLTYVKTKRIVISFDFIITMQYELS